MHSTVNNNTPIPDWYADARRAMDEVAQLDVFFVLGCQKSGTTWVQMLLNAHPNLCCSGEGHFGDVLAPVMQNAVNQHNNVKKVQWPFNQNDLYRLCRFMMDRTFYAYLERTGHQAQIKAVGDKTPESAMLMPFLNAMYPQAKFIHVIRDGRDGAVSGWAQLHRLNEAGQFDSFAHYAEYFAESHWKSYIHRARQAGASMPGRFHELQYESLLEDPLTETQRMLRFLEVAADDAATQACVDAASFNKLSGGRKAGEEQRDSHFRKGVAGDWTNHFDEQALRRFNAKAGDLLAELGYAEQLAT